MRKLSAPKAAELVVIFTAFLAAAFGFGLYLFPAIAPEIIGEFGFSYAEMGLTTSLVQASFLLFSPASGMLTAHFGPFRIILGSLLLCLVSLGGLAWAGNFQTMSVLLILLGGCAASIWAPMVEVVQQAVEPQHRGKAMGLISSGSSYGILVNSVLISFFLSAQGWRSVWMMTFAIVLLLYIYALARLRILRREMTGGTQAAANGGTAAKPPAPLAHRIRSLPPTATVIVLALMFLSGLACISYQTYLSSFLVDEHFIAIETVGLALSATGIAGMFSGFLMGWVADHITVRRALLLTYPVLALSTVLLLVFDGSTTRLLIASTCFGFAFAAIFGLVPAYISHVFRDGCAALVFSFGIACFGLGGIIGNASGGWLKNTTGTFELIYAVILAASVGSALLSLMMKSERQ